PRSSRASASSLSGSRSQSSSRRTISERASTRSPSTSSTSRAPALSQGSSNTFPIGTGLSTTGPVSPIRLREWLARYSYIYNRPIIPIDLRRDDWVVAYNLLRERKAAASVITAKSGTTKIHAFLHAKQHIPLYF